MVQVSRGKKADRYLRVTDEEHPVGAQLMGADPKDFAPAAERLVAAGFDVIDINFGCPVKKVLGRCRGGYLLGQVETALEIVSRVREAVPADIPVTVKMRRGLDDRQESRDNFFRIFDGAFQRGVAAITVHGRTVVQRYVGPSRWEFLREVKQHAGSRVVLGSGDLFTPQACLDMIAQTGVDGVTAARGAIGNPWIFPQARALAAGLPLPDPPSVREQRAVIAEHYRLADELYGPEVSSRHMRKFGIKYSQLHPQGRAVRDAFVAVTGPDEWRAVFERFTAPTCPAGIPRSRWTRPPTAKRFEQLTARAPNRRTKRTKSNDPPMTRITQMKNERHDDKKCAAYVPPGSSFLFLPIRVICGRSLSSSGVRLAVPLRFDAR